MSLVIKQAGEKRRRPEEDYEANDTNQDPKTPRHYAAAVYTIVNGEKKRVNEMRLVLFISLFLRKLYNNKETNKKMIRVEYV